MVYLCTLVILDSADRYPNPDPQGSLEYPCFVCGKEVLNDHAGIHCDDYHCWYHRRCINTVNNTYNILSKSNISRICAKCSSLNTTHINMNDNSIIGQQSYYSVLSDDHVDPPAPPQCTSTPVNSVRHKSEKNVSKPANKLTTIIDNTQSIKSKNQMIWKVIDTRKPEIVVVSETWLSNSIHNSEILPTNYEVYHQDRIDGGVLISVKNTLISQNLKIKSDCEIVGSRIECSKKNVLDCHLSVQTNK